MNLPHERYLEGLEMLDARSGADRASAKALFLRPLSWGRVRTMVVAAVLIAVVAVVDWRRADDVPLGFIYLLPMLLLGRFLRPWQIVSAALLCTILTEAFDSFPWNFSTGLPRDFLYFMAFFVIAVFNHQVSRSRERAALQFARIERESAGRLQAEQQLLSLIETSPAAIITTRMDGVILMANEAAHRLLDVPSTKLVGMSLHTFFPTLAYVWRLRAGDCPRFRTVMQTHGSSASGDKFLAEICFSMYETAAGVFFTGMILDSSEEFRSREESSLHQMLQGSRIAVSAMSHEIRNICGAIGAVHRNLFNTGRLSSDKDLEALSNLVSALEQIASVDLRPGPERLSMVDLKVVLEDLRIVIAPTLEENDVELYWKIAPHCPLVWADGTNLMQVLLNLTTNSTRALMARTSGAYITVETTYQDGKAVISVIDNGGGVKNSEHLFRPFQQGAQNVGLGLYLAKAFARSFSGDLIYRPTSDGSCFTVELNTVEDRENS